MKKEIKLFDWSKNQVITENIREFACYKELFEIFDKFNENVEQAGKGELKIGFIEILATGNDKWKNKSVLRLAVYTEKNKTELGVGCAVEINGKIPSQTQLMDARFSLKDSLKRVLLQHALYVLTTQISLT